jgi:serine/threonine protein kinase
MESDTGTSLLSPSNYLRERWEIIKKIGGGGFGEIYKALDHSTDQVRYIISEIQSYRFVWISALTSI